MSDATDRSTSAQGASAACPFNGDPMPASPSKSMPGTSSQCKTMVLTGASRGIGHATVKLFSRAGWRIITCSRHPFNRDRCPWNMGPEDHVQVDLADHRALPLAIADIRARLEWPPIARVGQQCRDFAEDGADNTAHDVADDADGDLDGRIPRKFPGADLARAWTVRRAEAGAAERWSTSLRSSARAFIPSPVPPMPPRRQRSPVSRARWRMILRHTESASMPSRPARSGPISCRPAPKRA